MTILYIDADACPVKEEVYRVADRYKLQVFVVSNSWIRTPQSSRITSVVVGRGPRHRRRLDRRAGRAEGHRHHS